MDSGLTGTLAGWSAQPNTRVEGDKVEEVEGPPIPTSDGNTSPWRAPQRLGCRLTRARPYAHARARVTSQPKSLYLIHGNRPQSE